MVHLLRDSDAMTITIPAPDLIDGKEGRRVLAAFYGKLLGMREFEPWGWLKLAKRPPDSKLQFALDDDGWSDERPPRWPDPEYPQQMHLDILVPDVEAAGRLVLNLGAKLLRDQGDFRVYADPAGHPFCLCPDPSVDSPKLCRLVFDCFSPRALAGFYEDFLGVEERLEDSPERVVINLDDEELPNIAFQHAQFPAARWPDPAYPAQLHVDYRFPDGAESAIPRAERLGAIHTGHGNAYADPAAHPFCL
ncbi:VOC family protein [Actinopolymorpha sp. B17G11]|uniref:VOC family protein n=1 Tax=unclassified Actinopolymorpha TaxID=2627063 RepID=UPI0032D973BE